ncbi:glycine cleavage system aminomethyltransferase GcvT [Desulfosarcina sp.]|uniref:glycine cleavage system aminomethyltransferase GcvT n=1 Tax=Desulfosarcina sp. TaxID=2027861 RepID=UPI0039707D22
MTELKRTVLYDCHVKSGAQMVPFGGWDMPVMYGTGILAEHLATRRSAGLFDVSHMGRFVFRGSRALEFLQYALTNNAAALDSVDKGAQYTLIPTPAGTAVDDAYLYRFVEDEYLLVVNAGNRDKDWRHFQTLLKGFDRVELIDRSGEMAMLSLQGPLSRSMVSDVIEAGRLPEPARNALSTVTIAGAAVLLARTGYTGEPLGFELFIPADAAAEIWEVLVDKGATPVGLGARDTLRLEAGLPLYGHELGMDPDGAEIPIFACPLAKFGVSFSPLKGDFVGRQALVRQHDAFQKILFRDFSALGDLPRIIRPLALADRGIARQGARVYKDGQDVGTITSGTMVPYWEVEGEGVYAGPSDNTRRRSICLAYLDSDVLDQDALRVEIRGKEVSAVAVPYHMRSESPPYTRPITFDHGRAAKVIESDNSRSDALRLLNMATENHRWRQQACINLIPSEMTASPLVRLLSISDPSFRYAEHRKLKAYYDAEVFYYQGCDFIDAVEAMLVEELKRYFGCAEVETRVISGQMANTAVYSAMLDYVNRADRKREPRRMRYVMNNHIGKGGHLSAQPMGALRDFVARDPATERPAVVNFPVLTENPFRIDVPAMLKRIDQYRPELIIFGKSMVICKEPVRQVRAFLDQQGIDAVVMYDMAHVLGLVGPHFQDPFSEGADLVTGSTHKTFFGTQRGVVAGGYTETDAGYPLWEAIERRTFPGSVSNHHLGTMVGLLMAVYEMNHFKDDYQRAVIANAKVFARALNDCGLDVAGDPQIGYTETHQVLVDVGYAKGPQIARRLEANNIICNYQAGPADESFSASGMLRMGVSEMTRFGMQAQGFQQLAQLIRDVVMEDKRVKEEVSRLRQQFLELRYCFNTDVFADQIRQMMEMLI